jgi:hypothetical protein
VQKKTFSASVFGMPPLGQGQLSLISDKGNSSIIQGVIPENSPQAFSWDNRSVQLEVAIFESFLFRLEASKTTPAINPSPVYSLTISLFIFISNKRLNEGAKDDGNTKENEAIKKYIELTKDDSSETGKGVLWEPSFRGIYWRVVNVAIQASNNDEGQGEALGITNTMDYGPTDEQRAIANTRIIPPTQEMYEQQTYFQGDAEDQLAEAARDYMLAGI